MDIMQNCWKLNKIYPLNLIILLMELSNNCFHKHHQLPTMTRS
jgi:hypothetical protein